MKTGSKGRGGFNVQSDGTAVTGELQWQNETVNLHAHSLTALGLSEDGRSAWFAGVGTGGEQIAGYVEDNGEPGNNDVFQLWVGGIPQIPGGKLTGGNIQIHK